MLYRPDARYRCIYTDGCIIKQRNMEAILALQSCAKRTQVILLNLF